NSYINASKMWDEVYPFRKYHYQYGNGLGP
ncbi:unnamed protein product, partial [marine sediment metagenome]